MKYKKSGFTLIEILITVVIIAILTGIAIPSYQNYILKSRRADGKTAILAAQLAEEKWRTSNITYTSTMTDLVMPTTSVDGYYTVAISGNTATAYLITATPVVGGQQAADADCASMAIDQDGTKTATTAKCW